jgi:hypothetical protein
MMKDIIFGSLLLGMLGIGVGSITYLAEQQSARAEITQQQDRESWDLCVKYGGVPHRAEWSTRLEKCIFPVMEYPE